MQERSRKISRELMTNYYSFLGHDQSGGGGGSNLNCEIDICKTSVVMSLRPFSITNEIRLSEVNQLSHYRRYLPVSFRSDSDQPMLCNCIVCNVWKPFYYLLCNLISQMKYLI